MSVKISRVQCEHYPIPLGIGEPRPRLSWRFESEGEVKDWGQVGYEIRLSRKKVGAGAKEEEEEFKVASSESVLVPWPGKHLSSREIVTVHVRAQGKSKDYTPWAEIVVEAGLLERSDWKANPISCDPQPANPTKTTQRPFRLRAEFTLPPKYSTVRLYITALGLYEAEVNGQRVGEEHLAPGWTNYNGHLVYRTFDLGKMVQPGTNVFGSWVGEGWYAGKVGFLDKRGNYGKEIGLMGVVEVDGEVVLSTGTGDGKGEGEGKGKGQWEWAYGGLVSAELLDGEVYDSNQADEGWTVPGTKSLVEWKKPMDLPFPKGTLISSQAPPVQVVDRIKPTEVITTPSGKTVLDFGQNFAGVAQILSEPPKGGTDVILRHAEVLEFGELGTRPLRRAKATDRIILGGKQGVKGWYPKFTSHGFRYVEITGWNGVSANDVVGLVTHSAMERTGHFNCSHKLINKLHKNVVWSTMGNTISIPTDCPQRDERLGWTGDIQVFAPTLDFLFDASGFLSGWFKDLYVDQKTLGGNVPVTIPNILTSEFNERLAVWGDVAVITPLEVYDSFVDKSILEQQYDSAILWLEKGVVYDKDTGLWDKNQIQLSDWLDPKAPPEDAGAATTDTILVADAYLIRTTRAMARFCHILGKAEEAKELEKKADGMIKAFYAEYVTPNGRVMSDTQTALDLLIQYDIYPPSSSSSLDYATLYGDRLGHRVEREDWKVGTGFAGTPIILHALTKSNSLHHAYRMLQTRDCPSWLSCVLLGATTIWERWDSMLQDGTINPGSMTSFNHYALGSVASFCHKVIGGISQLEPGWKKVLVKPQPGGTITSAEVEFLSPYGKVGCNWKIVGHKLEVEVEVPPNVVAQVELPGLKEEIGSGVRQYTVDWNGDERWPPKASHRGRYAPKPVDNWEP